MENLMIMVIALIIFSIMTIKDSMQKRAILSRMILDLRAINRQMALRLRYLEQVASAANQQHPENLPPPTDSQEIKRWKLAWAREVLGITEEKFTPEVIRKARTRAIKISHPDAGGSAERMRTVNEAIAIMESYM